MLQTKAVIKIYQSSGGYKDKLSGSKQVMQQLLFTSFTEVEIDNSWDNLCQTAKVVIPRKVRKIFGTAINSDLSLGDTIVNDLSSGNYRFISHDDTISADSQFTQIGNSYYRTNPLVEVGDVITIQLGYIIRNNGEQDTVGDYGVPYNGIKENKTGGNLPYQYVDDSYNLNSTQISDGGDNRDIQFYGYITALNIDIEGNITIECEDYMYYLKKSRIPNKVYNNNAPSVGSKYQGLNKNDGTTVTNRATGKEIETDTDRFTNPNGYSINAILYEMLETKPVFNGDNETNQGNTASGIQNIATLPIPLNIASTAGQKINGLPIYIPTIDTSDNIDTVTGDIVIQNATVYNFLKKIKDDYEIPSFFQLVGGVYKLYCTTFVYNSRIDNPDRQPEFYQYIFGTNIINSELEWKDNSNTNAGAVVKSLYFKTKVDENNATVKTKTNIPKKKLHDISVNVGDPTGPQFTFFYTTSNADIASNEDAVRKNMKAWGQQQLDKTVYTGYYGTFTTFGYPYVNWGDIVFISDPSMPERNGYYYVKRVITKANFDEGLIQEITLDYKIIGPTDQSKIIVNV